MGGRGITGHTGSLVPVSLPPWDFCDPGPTGRGRVIKALPSSAHRPVLGPLADSKLICSFPLVHWSKHRAAGSALGPRTQDW